MLVHGQASVQELFSPLTCGGALLLAVPGGEKDTQYMARLCQAQRVSCIVLVPSALEVLLQARGRLINLIYVLSAVTMTSLSLTLMMKAVGVFDARV